MTLSLYGGSEIKMGMGDIDYGRLTQLYRF
jgi:hypothetical protein